MRRLDNFLTLAALASVLWFYHWTVSTSGGFGDPGAGDYYHFLVQGWRQGHLYLSKEPPPEMVKLADPYDPAQNAPWRLGDASYFRGHYYLYFGAAPAFLLMLPYDVITGRDMPVGTAVFVYCVAGFLASAALWLVLRRRYFPESGVLSGALGVLVLGFGTHVLALVRRPLVWELPIAAGYAFSMLALLLVYAALHGKRPVLAITAAALSLGLAVASRPTCLFGAAMFLPPLWWWWRAHQADGTWRKAALGVAGGMGVCLVAICAHNYARFGNALEFGQRFQVSVFYVSRLHLFSPAYLTHNAYIYYFSPAHWSAQFPFVATSTIAGGPTGYLGTETMGGLAGTFPFLWLALTVPLAARGGRPGDTGALKPMLAAVVFFYVAVGGLILAFGGATPRYMVDFAPALGLLAACGWLGLEHWAQRKGGRRAIAPVALAAGIATAAAGILLSFDYHARMFHALQPQIWANLEQFFAGKK